jgi:hypothetical protein
VHARNRYNALKLVFVLSHIGSSSPPVNADCHSVVYGEKPRTDRTYCLESTTVQHSIDPLKACLHSYMYLLPCVN